MTKVDVWNNKQQRAEFFAELSTLLEKYANIAENMARNYTADPTAGWDPEYDPTSPVIVRGIVIVITHANMENFEDLQILEPYDQSHYLTAGMLGRASSIYGLDEVE